jgi:hypothetical protein
LMILFWWLTISDYWMKNKYFFCKIPGGMGENSMTSKYLRDGCFLMTFQLWV